MAKQLDSAREKGTFVEPADGQEDKQYALFNEIAGGEEGFDFATYTGLIGHYMKFYGELKAAADDQ